jgi:integrase/recombinase XerD
MKKALKINTINKEETCINEVMGMFIEDCKVRGLSKSTLENYSNACGMFVEFIGNKKMENIDKNDINKFVLYLQQRGNNNTSIKTRLKSINVFLKFGNINIDFPMIKQERNIKQPYTEDEIKQLLEKPKIQSYTQWRNHAIVSTFIGTGIRCRTLINLKISDIDFVNNTIFLDKTKTSKQYYIPLSTALKQTLKHYLSLYQHNVDDYLFVTLYGDQMDREALKQTIRDYNLKRGVTKTSVHLFRHTFAYNYLKNGGNIVYLQNILGHSKIETTRVYLLITNDDLKQNFDDYSPLDNMQRKGIKIKNN